MSLKKSVLLALAVGAVFLMIGAGSAHARLMGFTAATSNQGPYLGSEITISAEDNEQYLPSIAYNWKHDEYLVVWHNNWAGSRDIYAQRVSGQGQLLSWFAIPTSDLKDRAQPDVAYDPVNDRYLVVFIYDYSAIGTDWDIHGIFVGWDGPIPGEQEFTIDNITDNTWTPRVAYNRAREEFVVVWWVDETTDPDYLAGRRLKASDGSIPANNYFEISHASQDRVNPNIAYNLARNQFLVVYDNKQDVFATRFDGVGNILGGGEIGIASWPGPETYPSVAACGTADRYLVAWQNDQPDIYARFIGGNGATDATILHFDSTTIDEIYPEVGCNSAGNQFLVVWQHQYSSTSGPYGVRGQLVYHDKSLGDPVQIMAPTAGVTAEFTTPVVVGGGSNYLAVWEHDRAGTAFQDIHGRLITPNMIFLPLTLRSH